VSGAPLDPTVTKEHVDDFRQQVAPGLFQQLDVDRFPNSTLDALALANQAYRTDLQVGSGWASRSGTRSSRTAATSRSGSRWSSSPVASVVMPDQSHRAAVVADRHEPAARRVGLAALRL